MPNKKYFKKYSAENYAKNYKTEHYNHKKTPNPLKPHELEYRLSLIPEDTRDFTGRFCGDPIPNDPRR